MNEEVNMLEVSAAPSASIEWDQSQRDVISMAPGARLLVDAGPGTGKTAVACARVSQLISQNGLEPSNIWLISFTRIAVREIRDRITTYLNDSAAAYAIKIATLDSHAWAIHSGFKEDVRILGSYEENIEKVLGLVRENENVIEYLEGVEHLIIDEAQDIVGIRADLVSEIICKLSPACGVTVFADEAQAIYGFADDKEVQAGVIKELPFLEKIRCGVVGEFEKLELAKIHRTNSQKLLTIFSETRHKVLTASEKADEKLKIVRDEVSKMVHGKSPLVQDMALTELEDAFILYRRRCDVLLASSLLMQKGIAHRVRMSGLPVCLTPWVGATLSEYTGTNLNRDKFLELWSEKVHDTPFAICEQEEAWEHLVRVAGRTEMTVDIQRLRRRLGRKQPPAELCHSEFGLRGPIVSTIHASKGRETDIVHLMLPKPYTQFSDVDQDEEARVVFVGATRARSRLLAGSGFRQFASRLESGRTYCLHTKGNNPKAQLEIGHENDIGAEGLAGRRFFASPDEVRNSQNRICRFMCESVSLIAVVDMDVDFVYRLKENEQDQCLAVLSEGAMRADLFAIARSIQKKIGGGPRRPPNKIQHLHARGIRTIVLPPDAPEVKTLYEPWRSSGIMIAPLVLGYSTVHFPNRRG